MYRRNQAEELRQHAELTWSLADKARNEGNHELARELMQIARETEMRAMSTWPVSVRRAPMPAAAPAPIPA